MSALASPGGDGYLKDFSGMPVALVAFVPELPLTWRVWLWLVQAKGTGPKASKAYNVF